MRSCTIGEICDAVNGTLLRTCEAPITAVTTDSRRVGEGQLFIPLVGARFDGHDYIDSAFANGAAATFLAARRPV